MIGLALLGTSGVGCTGGQKTTERPTEPPATRTERTPLPPPSPTADAGVRAAAIREIAHAFAVDLSDRSKASRVDHKLVLVLAAPSQNSAGFSEALSSALLADKTFSRSFVIVQSQARSAAEAVKDLSGSRKTWSNPDGSSTNVDEQNYLPGDIYFLTPSFREGSGAGAASYVMNARVDHPQSRQVLIVNDYEAAASWDSAAQRWNISVR